ncbi:MAG: hypothetical protein JWN70_6998, partial [Planctomycetaceae bacterium]|nr:hypothetical protein [Planctomycetaceae bacterium]
QQPGSCDTAGLLRSYFEGMRRPAGVYFDMPYFRILL